MPRNLIALLPVLAAALSASARAGALEPAVQRSVVEDDKVRIEELRVRGITRSIVVRPKAASAPTYEIVPTDPGRDAEVDRRSAGQRVWRLFSF